MPANNDASKNGFFSEFFSESNSERSRGDADPSAKQSFYSQFFSELDDDETLSETVPASHVKSSVAENRRILNILFIIDVSGSMRGQRIGMVNNAMENIIKELKKRDELNAVLKIGIMEFSETAEWTTPQPIPVQDFVFVPIQAQPWLTNYGPAFTALHEKLSRSAFLNPALGQYFEPLILFVSDGEPTDVAEFPKALQHLCNNGWFKNSAKYAIAVGEEARSKNVIKVLSQFTGMEQNVRYADEGEALCGLIQFVALEASSVQTSMVSDSGKSGGGNSIFADKDSSLFSSMFD